MVGLFLKIESQSTHPLKVYTCLRVLIIYLQRYDQGKIIDRPTLFKIAAKAGIEPSQISIGNFLTFCIPLKYTIASSLQLKVKEEASASQIQG